jgi:tetratricopeptide (TPR) repeat protein
LSALGVLGHWHALGGLYPEARWLLRRCVDESRARFESSSGSRRVWTDASGDVSIDVVDSAHAFDSQEPRCLEELLRVERLAGDGNDARDLAAWRKRLWSEGPDLEKQLIRQARFSEEAWHAVGRTTSDENTLAWYYRGKGRPLDAIATWEHADRRLKESLALYGRHGGEGNAWRHLDILLGLGEAREEVDRLADAEAAYRSAIGIAESELHPSHAWRLETRARLAAVLHRRGDLAHAEEHWRRYLAAAGQQRGVDHADYARGLEGLAKTLAESGHPQASFDLLRRALRIRAAYAKRMDAVQGLPLPPALRSPPSPAN